MAWKRLTLAVLIIIANTKNKPPKKIKSTPLTMNVKSYRKHKNVKKLDNGGKTIIRNKKNDLEFMLFRLKKILFYFSKNRFQFVNLNFRKLHNKPGMSFLFRT